MNDSKMNQANPQKSVYDNVDLLDFGGNNNAATYQFGGNHNAGAFQIGK